MQTIPIFFAFNNDYIEPASVAFFSLLNKARSTIFFDMYVLHSDISTSRQQVLFNIVSRFKNAKLTFISVGSEFNDIFSKGNYSLGTAGSKFTSDTLTRCFASRFFPQYSKIIYSDVDVIFVNDISELYDIDLNGKYFAGVKNAFTKFSEYELSHLSSQNYAMLKDKYIAGGIFVMNLEKIREDKLDTKMLAIANDNSIIKRWPDQDIINIASEGKVAFIPLNYISYPYMKDLLNNPSFTSVFTREELYDSIINPKIIHFASNKPWNSNPNYSNLWWTYFDYLGLEKTKIFDLGKNKKCKNKKAKKYKILFLIFLLISILLFIIICGICLKLKFGII